MKGKAHKRKNGWVVTPIDDWYWSPSGYRKRKQDIPIHEDYVNSSLYNGLEVEFDTFIDKVQGTECAKVEIPEEVVIEEEKGDIPPESSPEPIIIEEVITPVIIEEPKQIETVKNKINMEMETNESFFTKNRLIRITIICALLTQINHAASLFYLLSDQSTFSYVMSWVFAVSLESSIYIFTMFGKRNTALFFGLVSWAVNILHYWFEVGFTQKFVAMNIISPIIPITIYFYSELIQQERPAEQIESE